MRCSHFDAQAFERRLESAFYSEVCLQHCALWCNVNPGYFLLSLIYFASWIFRSTGSSWKVHRCFGSPLRLWQVSVSWCFLGIGASGRRTCRRYLAHNNLMKMNISKTHTCLFGKWGRMRTWEECEHHWHPAHYIGPGEPPAAIAFTVVVHCHACVDGHGQQHKEAYTGERTIGFNGCRLSHSRWPWWLEERTGEEEEDAGCKCLVNPVKGGGADEGHSADHNANETSQQGKNHEGPSGIPVRCGWGDETTW